MNIYVYMTQAAWEASFNEELPIWMANTYGSASYDSIQMYILEGDLYCESTQNSGVEDIITSSGIGIQPDKWTMLTCGERPFQTGPFFGITVWTAINATYGTAYSKMTGVAPPRGSMWFSPYVFGGYVKNGPMLWGTYIDFPTYWTYNLTQSSLNRLWNNGNPSGIGGWTRNMSPWRKLSDGNASIDDYGSIIQFKAYFTSVNKNFSAFLTNLTFDYAAGNIGSFNFTNNTPSTMLGLTLSNFSMLVTGNNSLYWYQLSFNNGTGWYNNTPKEIPWHPTNDTELIWDTFLIGNPNTTQQYMFYITDVLNNSNNSPIYMFNSTYNYPSLSTCSNGKFLSGHNNQILFYVANNSAICNVTIMNSTGRYFQTNQTQVWTQGFQNLTINYGKELAGRYYAGMNCTDGTEETVTFDVVNQCFDLSFYPINQQQSGGENMPLFEFSIVMFLTAIAVVMLIAGAYTKSFMLVIASGVMFIVTGFMYFTPALGVQQLAYTNTTSNVTFDSSGGIAGVYTVTQPDYNPMQNELTGALGLFNLALGLAFILIGMSMYLAKPAEFAQEPEVT